MYNFLNYSFLYNTGCLGQNLPIRMFNNAPCLRQMIEGLGKFWMATNKLGCVHLL